MSFLNYLKSKNELLGKPGQGAHRHFGLGFAVLDVLMTLTLSVLIVGIDGPVGCTFIMLFLIGQFFHIMFGVDTAFIHLLKTL